MYFQLVLFLKAILCFQLVNADLLAIYSANSPNKLSSSKELSLAFADFIGVSKFLKLDSQINIRPIVDQSFLKLNRERIVLEINGLDDPSSLSNNFVELEPLPNYVSEVAEEKYLVNKIENKIFSWSKLISLGLDSSLVKKFTSNIKDKNLDESLRQFLTSVFNAATISKENDADKISNIVIHKLNFQEDKNQKVADNAEISTAINLLNSVFSEPTNYANTDIAIIIKKTQDKSILDHSNNNSGFSEKSKRSSEHELFYPYGASKSYSSQEDCESATDNCSDGHGKCVLISKSQSSQKTIEAWACACSTTIDEKTGRTIYWAGPLCSKIDYTLPFNLFLWFGIIFIGTLAAIVGSMLRMGSEELPGVLTAGAYAKPK